MSQRFRQRISILVILMVVAASLLTYVVIAGANDDVSSQPTYRYAASANSKVFHYIGCSHVERISPENLVLFETREVAVASGRRPCKTCTP